jgi:twitching motility protein PilT
MNIQELLKASVEKKSSDLHLLPGFRPLMRIDGKLTPEETYPVLTTDLVKELVYSLMVKEEMTKFEEKRTIDMSLVFPDIGNFRLSVIHQLKGVSAVFRVIADKIPSFEELNLPPVFKKLLGLTNGLILVTGPTGSGKSTTLATMLDYINTFRNCHIITIEDPIEYVYQPKKCAINQIQVGRDTPDFSSALRASLRHDPDVIMVGEMRDLETISLAITAAETGHLVMATLHASSAPYAISRIADCFPTEEKNRVRNLLSESIQAVICQTLVKKATGTGRVAAFEIMLASPAIRNLIRQDMAAHMLSTIQTSGDMGMCTMEQYLQVLAEKRLITTAVARSTALSRGQGLAGE